VSYPESSRDPLPRREAFPIGREILDPALRAVGVEHLDLVYFMRFGIDDWQETDEGSLLTVDFRAKGWLSERIELRVHAVPAEHKQQLGDALTEALPRVASWIRRAETGENVWRSADHTLVVRWTGGAVRIDDR
jgi:hypothetical protein